MDAPEADADFPMKLFIAAFDGVGAGRTCSRRTLGAVALATGTESKRRCRSLFPAVRRVL